MNKVVDSGQSYQMTSNIELLLRLLADENSQQFICVTKSYLNSGDLLELQPYGIVHHLILCQGSDTTFDVIRNLPSAIQNKWLFAIYVNLPPNEVRANHIPELLDLYRVAPLSVIPHRFDYFERFLKIEPMIYVAVARVLLDRPDHEQMANLLGRLLPHDSASSKSISSAFRDDADVLMEVYFLVCNEADWSDYNATTFCLLLDMDMPIGERYVEWLFHQRKQNPYISEHRDFSNLWRRADIHDVMERIVRAIQSLPTGEFEYRYEYLKAFFVPPNPEQKREAVIQERMTLYLEHLIGQNSRDMELIDTLFEFASEIIPQQRKRLVECFLAFNSDLDNFDSLSFFVSSGVVWGSPIPVLEEKIEFLRSLLPLLDELPFLRHRAIVEARINYWRERIDGELRRQFSDNDW